MRQTEMKQQGIQKQDVSTAVPFWTSCVPLPKTILGQWGALFRLPGTPTSHADASTALFIAATEVQRSVM